MANTCASLSRITLTGDRDFLKVGDTGLLDVNDDRGSDDGSIAVVSSILFAGRTTVGLAPAAELSCKSAEQLCWR